MITLTKNAVYVIGKMLDGKKDYGLRMSKVEGCCSILFNINLDKRAKSDKLIKTHGDIKVFADRQTMEAIKTLSEKNIFRPAKIDFVKTHLGPSFFTNNNRLGINIWEHDIE